VDVVSHYVIPYALAILFLGATRPRSDANGEPDAAALARWRHRAALAVAFGIGGVAPDLDALYSWARHTPGLYFLQHRGVSHSLIGAPLHALAGVGLLHAVALIFPRRMGWLRFRRGYVPAAILGSLTHLALDALTYMGIPLLWPLQLSRVSLNIYPFLLIWMFPIASILLVLHVFKRLDHARFARYGVLLVVLMILSGGARLVERPDVNEQETVFPRPNFREWILVTPDPQEPQWRNETKILPGSEAAVAHVRETSAYRGLRMSTMGPVVIETRALDLSTWEVNVTALVARYDAVNGAAWTPAHPKHAWGLLSVTVDNATLEMDVKRLGW
jgi:membrane-bound metal-dependent hydrolase YbcI (DUF457 family)